MPPVWEQTTESWVHHYPYILNNGRTTHIAPKDTPEDDKDGVI